MPDWGHSEVVFKCFRIKDSQLLSFSLDISASYSSLQCFIFFYNISINFKKSSPISHCLLPVFIYMIPGSKAINHDALAQKWLYGLMTRPNMRIKVEHMLHDIRILGRIVGVQSTEQSVWHLLTSTSYY